MKKYAFVAVALLLGSPAYGAGIHSPVPSGFAYSGQQILNRLQTDLAHPARYTGLFNGPTNTGRVASVTHCRRKGATASTAVYTCDLVGVPVGTTANFQIVLFNSKLMSVILSVQNDVPKYSGLTAIAAELLEGAVVQAVDPLAQQAGLSRQTHEEMIMAELGAGHSMNLRRDARADGLTFEQRMVAGDLVLDVHPTGGA